MINKTIKEKNLIIIKNSIIMLILLVLIFFLFKNVMKDDIVKAIDEENTDTIYAWFWVSINGKWTIVNLDGSIHDSSNDSDSNNWGANEITGYENTNLQFNSNESTDRFYLPSSLLESVYGIYGYDSDDSSQLGKNIIVCAEDAYYGDYVYAGSGIVNYEETYWVPILSRSNNTTGSQLKCNIYYMPNNSLTQGNAWVENYAENESFYTITIEQSSGSSTCYALNNTTYKLDLSKFGDTSKKWMAIGENGSIYISDENNIITIEQVQSNYTIKEISEDMLYINYDANNSANITIGSYSTTQYLETITLGEVESYKILTLTNNSYTATVNGYDITYSFVGWIVNGDRNNLIEPGTQLTSQEISELASNSNYLSLTAKWTADLCLIYDVETDFNEMQDSEYAYLNYSGTFKNKPTVDNEYQDTDSGGKLYEIKNGDDENNRFIFHSIYYYNYLPEGKQEEIDYDNFADESEGASHIWGIEFEFLYWETEDVNGEICYFEENAEIIINNDEMYIIDINGDGRIISGGSVMIARYREFSGLVFFFVNYKGTILDVTGDVGPRNNGSYTYSVIVGHIYYGKEITGSDSIYAVDANAKITQMFSSSYNSDNEDTQIVIECFLTVKNGELEECIVETGATVEQVDEHIMTYLWENEETIYLCSGNSDPQPTVSLSDTSLTNYSVRWYVLKELYEGWHVDGVLVANTDRLLVTTTNYGLSDVEDNSLMDYNSYNIEAYVEENNDFSAYFTMVTSNSTDDALYGLYSYNDKQENTYSWVANLINGELYKFEEENYDVEGYNCSTVMTIYYSDGTMEQSIGKSGQISAGEVETISFDNYYTPTGTGMFYIEKVMENSEDVTLSGAEFTLTKEEGTEYVATSGSDGIVFFNELTSGNYTLKETNAPTGFKTSDEEWKVTVEKNGNSVTVMIGTTILYTTENGIENKYIITNAPVNDEFTLKILKVNVKDTDEVLSGAIFKVYGAYEEASDILDTIIVNDVTYYYLGTTDATDVNGVINYSGTAARKLTLGNSYVLVEETAPDGYYLDATPIVIENAGNDNENYSNGILELTIGNLKKSNIEITLPSAGAVGCTMLLICGLCILILGYRMVIKNKIVIYKAPKHGKHCKHLRKH